MYAKEMKVWGKRTGCEAEIFLWRGLDPEKEMIWLISNHVKQIESQRS